MSDDHQPAPNQQDIDHEIGQHNVQVFGLDIHNPVFVVSALLVVAFVIGTLLFLDQAALAFIDMRAWITSAFDWFFMITANIVVLFCLGVAYSRLGRVRLGGADAKPRYGYPGWLAMLFAAGVGIGLMFFGVLEPVTHSLNPPIGVDPADSAAARAAGMSAAIAHWGLHAWAIYAVVGLSLAYFCFNQGMPLTLRSAFFPLIGNRVWGPFGHFIDVSRLCSQRCSASRCHSATAHEQIAGGLNYLFGIPTGNSDQDRLDHRHHQRCTGIGRCRPRQRRETPERNQYGNGRDVIPVRADCWAYTLVILATMGNAVVDYLYYLPGSEQLDRPRRFRLPARVDDVLLGVVDFLVAFCRHVHRTCQLRPHGSRVHYLGTDHSHRDRRTVDVDVWWHRIGSVVYRRLPWRRRFGAGTRPLQDARATSADTNCVNDQCCSDRNFLCDIGGLRLSGHGYYYGRWQTRCAGAAARILVCASGCCCGGADARRRYGVTASVDDIDWSAVRCCPASYVCWPIKGPSIRITNWPPTRAYGCD